MLTLLKGACVFAPTPLGHKDVLLAGEKIIAIEDTIALDSSLSIDIVDATQYYLIPGLVDSLVHISGGGGEAGFASRTPQMNVTDAFRAGITTVVGALGTDDVSRTHSDLLAKAKGLREEGLNAFIHTGSYHVPIKTLGESISHDILFLHECIGVGEVAIADHRGRQPTAVELAKIAAEARTAGILSKKQGTVSIHVGTGKQKLDLLFEVARSSDIPLDQFYPTHMNRNSDLLMAGIEFAKAGGVIDFTASTTQYDLANGELAAAEALAYCLEHGVDATRLTMSSDGHASLPIYDKHNRLIGFEVGSEQALYDAFKQAVLEFQVPFDKALASVTRNPAQVLGLHKGILAPGCDADCLLIDRESFEIVDMWCLGKRIIKNKNLIAKGFFA
ncbi:Isoaspartyl dipeptidase [Pseudoalteromonas luteoviolacea B = ATCC 29581]|nr:Isoaspartyl dipeptidase [Pseudoalteromonas luteoviolacea B = ATCC 29581]